MSKKKGNVGGLIQGEIALKTFYAIILAIVISIVIFNNVGASELKYVYDDLGQLYQVIDEQGKKAGSVPR